MKKLEEIVDYFNREPRFNVVVIKTNKEEVINSLSDYLDFISLDLANEVAEGNIHVIDSYTGLLNTLKDIVKEKEGKGIIFVNMEFLLSALEKNKRKNFFRNLLQTRYSKPIVVVIKFFFDELPNIEQKYNVGMVIEI